MTAMPLASQPDSEPLPPGPYTPPPRAAWFVRFARSLNPFTLFFGPVFQREMRTTSRRRGTFTTRLIFVLIALAIVIAAYYSATYSLDVRSGVSRLIALQNIGPDLVRSVLLPQFFVLAIIAANLTSPTIGQERRRRTLPVLAVTPLTAGQVICSTLAAKMVQILLLSLAIVPLLLAVRVFGGLETEAIAAITIVQISTAIMMGALGILGATLSPRAHVASGLAVLMLILLSIVPLAFYAVWSNWLGIARPAPQWPVVISPTMSVFAASGIARGFGIGNPLGLAMGSAASNLIIATLACLLATRMLRVLMRRDAATDGPVVKVRTKKTKRAASNVLALPTDVAEAPDLASATIESNLPASAQPNSGSRDVSDRPVLWRELRRATFTSRTHLILAIILLSGLFLLLYGLGSGGPADEGVAGTMTILLAIALLFLAATSNAAAIAGEVEAKTWGLLLTTPLSARQILWSKVAGGACRLWLVPLVLMLHLTVCVIAGSLHPFIFVVVIPVLAGSVLLLCTTGTILSLRAARPGAAATTNIGVGLAIWFGPIIVGGILSGLINLRHNEWLISLWTMTNPIALIANAFSGLLGRNANGRIDMPGFGRLDLVEYGLLCFGYTALCAFISWALIAWASYRWRAWSVRRL